MRAAAVKIARAYSITRLVPKRSPIHPDAGIHTARLSRYPVTTHSIDAVGTWNCVERVGRATLMIVESRMLTNNAATYTIATMARSPRRASIPFLSWRNALTGSSGKRGPCIAPVCQENTNTRPEGESPRGAILGE